METLIAILMPVTFLILLALEHSFPARPLPKVRGWLFKGFVFFVLTGTISSVLPVLTAAALGPLQPFHLSGLGTVGGALVGYLAADLLTYGVHRLLHNVPFLWRWAHQMHHSAERLDVAGSNYFHPFDMLILGFTSVLPVTVLGLRPDAAALAGFIGFLVGTFAHMNVRTPVWLGYIVQRPEAHSVHHARGVHAYNYGTFMLWDIVFGTFRNPASFVESAGFWDGASAELGPMLVGRDIKPV